MSEWKIDLIEPPVGMHYLVAVFVPKGFRSKNPELIADRDVDNLWLYFDYVEDAEAPECMDIWDTGRKRLDIDEKEWQLIASIAEDLPEEPPALPDPPLDPRRIRVLIANTGGSDQPGSPGKTSGKTGTISTAQVLAAVVASFKFDKVPKIKGPIPRWRSRDVKK